MKELTLEYLEDLVVLKTLSPKLKTVLEIFIHSMNDWRIEVNDLKSFDKLVMTFIGRVPNQKSITASLATLDFSKHAWEIESLSQLKDVFEYYDKDLSLNQIIMKIKEELNEYLVY